MEAVTSLTAEKNNYSDSKALQTKDQWWDVLAQLGGKWESALALGAGWGPLSLLSHFSCLPASLHLPCYPAIPLYPT